MTSSIEAANAALAETVQRYADTPPGEALPADAEQVVDALLGALERGAVRAAERGTDGVPA